jgi:subtilase family serine protease
MASDIKSFNQASKFSALRHPSFLNMNPFRDNKKLNPSPFHRSRPVHFLLKPAGLLLTLGIALSAFSQAKVPNRITQAIDDRETTQLRGSAHPLLRHAADQGRMDGGIQLDSVSLTFKRTAAQDAAVEKLLAGQQDPKSPDFHKWLTPEQYADRFGVSTADLNKVVSWLQSEGFTVNRVARGRTQVWFTGSVSQIETVFRTEMHRYTVNGEAHFANAIEPAVPAAIADVVLGVHGLSNFRPKSRARIRKVAPEEVKENFTSSISGNHYVAPDDFATIYDVKALYMATCGGVPCDGRGVGIAVAGQSAINLSDIDAFRAAAGLPARTASNFTTTLVPNSGTSVVVTGDVGESSLDLEWAEAVAKGASETFVYVGNAQNSSVFEAFFYAIDNNIAPVISMSYGNCEQNLPSSFLTTMQQETQRANLQGQTISAASGDFGVADCDSSSMLPAQGGLGVDIPGALPYVTSVGGTSFSGDLTSPGTYWTATNNANNGSALQYIPETAWNNTSPQIGLSATGGGASTLFSKPSWQTGTGVPNDGQRDVPDIALAADPNHDGYLLCATDSGATPPQGPCVSGFRDSSNNLNVAGGTSFGAPTFSGIVAILNQKTGSKQGNVNPTLYALAASTPSAFHDITSGNNIVPCGTGTKDCPTTGALQYGFTAGAGYDQVTGLGTIDANVLLNNWSSGNPTAADFSLFGSLVTVATPGGTGTSSITVDGRNGYSGSVSFTCTAPASAFISCSISGSPVALNSSTTSGTVTLTINTMHAALEPAGLPFWFTGGGGMLAGVFLLAIPSRRRRLSVALALVTVALIVAAVGCGGSSSSTPKGSGSGTPVGNYTVTVNATDGTTSHSTNVAVAVQ